MTCPKCKLEGLGEVNGECVRSWFMEPKGRKTGKLCISIWKCPKCGHKWRTGETVQVEYQS